MEHMHLLPTPESLAQVTANPKSPCISLYQPTHRFAPDNRQDLIRYENLIKEIDEKLKGRFNELERKKMLTQFRNLTSDREFWNHTLDGMAILASPDVFQVYTVPRVMPELTVVADSFHKKPLKKFLQSTDQYHLLALSLDEIELFQGNRNGIEKIDPGPDVPRTIDEALGRDIEKDTKELPAFSTIRGGRIVLNYGRGGGKDEREIDQERWFRAVDNAITEHITNRTRLPLVLVALAEHHGAFRPISQNPCLQEEGITMNPKALDRVKLKELAWAVMEPKYHARLDSLKDDYKLAHSKELGSNTLEDVAKAASEGRVSVLFLEEDKILPGHLNRETGAIEPGDLSQGGIDDLLDDLGELVEETGGRVYLVPRHHMPSETGLAAIYRY